MSKLNVFISSVQSEFAKERQILFDYLMQDAMLGLFFEPFIFEKLPALEQSPNKTYLDRVGKCDIYIGLFGENYGYEDENGISPTEHEFNMASESNKARLIFLSSHTNKERNPKEILLIKKAEQEVIRKTFINENDLKTNVYASLVHYLEEKQLLRIGPFDAAINKNCSLQDIDNDKLVRFVNIAKSKRGFPLSAESPKEEILTHLNLLTNDRITNAALLLFADKPQQYFISSEIKCLQFHGTEIAKPIPSYQVYKGDVFQLVDQAVDFVLSRINLEIGTRDTGVDVPIEYEIPRAVVAEAIVNAVAHRDYTSNGSVQVMLFRDRLEIWNPGQLPQNLTLNSLREPHSSFPANPLLANSMYLAGYVEKVGTGTRDMIRLCRDKELKEPDFVQDDVFKTIIWRVKQLSDFDSNDISGDSVGVSGEVSSDLSKEVKRIVTVVNREMKRSEIQEVLQLKHDDNFRISYISPALECDVIEMTHPDTPNHPKQKYRLTAIGIDVRKTLLPEHEGDYDTVHDTDYDTVHDTDDINSSIEKLIVNLSNEMSRPDLQEKLKLAHTGNFRKNYLIPAIEQNLIEMTIPQKPKSKKQKYKLTEKGLKLKMKLKK